MNFRRITFSYIKVKVYRYKLFLNMSITVDQIRQVTVYIQPIHFTLSIVTNILNVRVVCCRVLRLSPCTHYFLAYAIVSIIYTCLLCPTEFLKGYQINWANEKFTCGLSNYLLVLFPFQANLMLVFTAFDRYCSSSQSRQLYSASTIRTAKIFIIIGTISCFIYIAPMVFTSDWDAEANLCIAITDLLINVYVSSQGILYYIVAPLLMVIFRFLTISNIRKQTARIGPLPIISRKRRTEGSLVRMLLLQIIIHLIIILPYGITYMMNLFNPSTQTPQILAICVIFVAWQQCDYFISFFLYIVSATVY